MSLLHSIPNGLISGTIRKEIKYYKNVILIKTRRSYRSFCNLLKKAGTKMEIVRYSTSYQDTFFGYHDKTPFSPDNELILACCSNIKNSTPSENDVLHLGMFRVSNPSEFIEIGTTTAWCWQQGCMLQWLPTEKSLSVIFNNVVGQYHCSMSMDVQKNELLKRYDRPIYCASPDGRWALSVSFSRLHRLRPGYGYCGNTLSDSLSPAPNDDGIWLIDITTGSSQLIIPLELLAELEPQISMQNCDHYVNHVVFSPSSKRFVFLHLWVYKGKRYSRMLSSDLEGTKIRILTNDQAVSHFCWTSDDSLIAYLYLNNGDSSFYMISDSDEKKLEQMEWLPQGDGHPTCHVETSRIVIDSYPDNYGEQNLYYVQEDNSLRTLGKFYSMPVRNPEYRCDLHPRWDREGQIVCLDSTHEGNRAIYTINLNS